jgi:hypothetical protein
MAGGAPIPECLVTPGDNCVPVWVEVLCDDNQSFLRRYVVNCDTGDILGIFDTELDGTTPYVTVGTIEACAGGAVSGDVETRKMCDLGAVPETPFLRTQVYNDSGIAVITVDTEVDGLTPYVAIGPIDFECACEGCIESNWAQRRIHLVGISAWARPVNVREVTVKVRALDAAGSVTIDDGTTVTPMFVGDEETWQAPSGEVFLGTFDVNLAGAGDIVTILWTERI